MTTFEKFTFNCDFGVQMDPEFPGDGDWAGPVVGFDRDGAVMSQFDSRWGPAVVVRIEPRSTAPWVAMFAAGGLGPVRGAFATPDPTLLTVVADGLAYLIRANLPGQPAQIAHDQVHQVFACNDPPLLLLVRFIDIVAVGAGGIAWATPRLCVDGLLVQEAGRKGGSSAPATTSVGRQP